MNEIETIRTQLEALGLCNEDTVITVDDGVYRVVTSGRFSKEFSRLGKPVRASNDDMAMMFGYKIKCVDELKPQEQVMTCMIKDCGFQVVARFRSELIAACILLEKMCKAELMSRRSRIGKVHHLNRALCKLEHTIYLKKYSKKSREAEQSEASVSKPAPAQRERVAMTAADVPDLALREEIIRYGKLLVENRLIQATWGNVSARIDENRFLITPSGVDYDRIRPEEIVEINIEDGTYAKGLNPSSEKKLHRLIYAERPDIGAIIHTHSSNCQVFAACHKGLPAYPCAKYAVSGSGKLAENVAAVMADHDGCIMANHGFVTGADTLEKALAQAIEAERTAGAALGI